ncbi:MAG: bacterioferritin [Phycisphaerae bacterium]|nr:MAG: bacterioferritin [Phycisphaerae bacterium]
MASKDLIDGLNHALNREVGTFLRYMLQAATIKGSQWEPVRVLYSNEVQDEVGHAQLLANEIRALGGTPTLSPDLTAPPEDVPTMLANDIEQERIDVVHYIKLAELAEKEGHFSLKMQMEDQAADEDGHAKELKRLLN